MATFRCPKHDVTFTAEKAPTQHGHAKCPFCNPKAAAADAEKKENQEPGAPVQD